MFYAVPPGFTAVLRDFDVYYGGGLFRAGVYLRGTSGQTIWFNSFGGSGGQYASWRGRQVAAETDVISVHTEDNMDVTLSGYLLELP